MEWSREKCVALVDVYEKYPELWNPKHGLYYNKVKKHDAWVHLDEFMECPRGESKKKMESLLASFRREKAKGKKSVGTGKGRQEIYITKWFAFGRMGFLLDRDEPRGTLNSMEEEGLPDAELERQTEVEEEEPKEGAGNSENSQNVEADATPMGTSETPIRTVRFQTKQLKRKKPESGEDPRIGEALDILKTAASSNSIKSDECGIYGQHVAHKLRSYLKTTRDIVQHHINNIMFSADMGQYNNYNVETRPSTSSPNSAVPSTYSDTSTSSNTFTLIKQSVPHSQVPSPSPQHSMISAASGSQNFDSQTPSYVYDW